MIDATLSATVQQPSDVICELFCVTVDLPDPAIAVRTEGSIMHRPLSVLVGAVVAGLVLVGCAASPNAQPNGDAAEQPSELVFAVVPTDDSAELQKAWLPVAAIIEDATGIPTTIQAVSSNSGVIEAQVAERADIAAYGAFSYYLASGVADVVPVAMDQRTPEPGSGAVQS